MGTADFFMQHIQRFSPYLEIVRGEGDAQFQLLLTNIVLLVSTDQYKMAALKCYSFSFQPKYYPAVVLA